MSQNARILKHLRRKSITPLEALRLYGCFRLASRIFTLRKEGHNIDTKIVSSGNKSFAKYILKK